MKILKLSETSTLPDLARVLIDADLPNELEVFYRNRKMVFRSESERYAFVGLIARSHNWTEQVKPLIKADGWEILKGPHYNIDKGRRGVHIWSIKTQFTLEELAEAGLGPEHAKPRTARFRGVFEEGELVGVQHVPRAMSRKLGVEVKRRQRRQRKRRQS